MSLSQPTLQNPASRFFEWSGSKGTISYYDKEKKESINVPLPFEFIVLDKDLATIVGYSDADESSFWSNEIRGMRDEFTVRTKKGVRYIGTYKNDQGIVQTPQGARYARSVYIAFEDGGELVIGNFKFVGASLNAWIDFCKTTVVENGKVRIDGSTEGKKGTTVYKIPTFVYDHLDDVEYDAAVTLDKALQIYLGKYFAARAVDDSQHVPDMPIPDELGKASQEEIDDFELRKRSERADGYDPEDPNALNDLFPE
jgi:hypothetical protein